MARRKRSGAPRVRAARGSSAGQTASVPVAVLVVVAVLTFVAGYAASALFGGFTFARGNRELVLRAAPAEQAGGGDSGPAAASGQASGIDSLKAEALRNPGSAAAWISLGNAYFDGERYPEAIEAYKRSLEIAPGDPDVWTDLGVMYRRTGQPNRAVEAFDRARGLDPRHQECRFNKGVVLLYDLQDRSGALQAWLELAAINPTFVAPNGQSIQELIRGLQ